MSDLGAQPREAAAVERLVAWYRLTQRGDRPQPLDVPTADLDAAIAVLNGDGRAKQHLIAQARAHDEARAHAASLAESLAVVLDAVIDEAEAVDPFGDYLATETEEEATQHVRRLYGALHRIAAVAYAGA